MAVQNYVLLERIELNDTTASVTFSNIPQSGYTDLKLVYSARGTASATFSDLNIRFNGSATGYSERMLSGNGSTAFSAATSGTLINWGAVDSSTATASTFSNGEIYIPNYTGSQSKSISQDVVTENNLATANSVTMNLHTGLWANSAAITSISLTPASGSLVSGSTFSLYGIANSNTTPVVAPKATGGNVISTDGTYWYHAFLSNGTFTPAVGLSCDYLVIAGGGSGGSHNGGGGGAGGYLTSTGYSVTGGTGYAVTIGAGGAAVTTPSTHGNNGSNSVFATITSTGGGGGGSYAASANSIVNGAAGGSGGGASSYAGTTAGTVGAASPAGQGNAGGAAFASGYSSGGGGGAGAVGGTGNTTFNTGGSGGAGLNTLSSWATATGTGVSGYYAGGGGGADGDGTGGTAGSGGGGAGSGSSGAASNATTNTGGGGGGAGLNTSGAGGSGIVIVRYTVA